MEPLTIRIPEDLKETLDDEADDYSVSTSEYVRELIRKGREYDDLRERLDAREDRIEELEDQLSKRSQVEEKIDVLAERVEEDEPNPPFFVEWYRWWSGR